MARPQINLEDIEFPTIDTPMADFAEQACGESYPVSFLLKQPYQGVGVWEYELPIRANPVISSLGTSMSDAQLGMLSNLGTDAAKAIIASQDLLAGKNPALPVRLVASGGDITFLGNVKNVVDPKNLQAIQHLIDRAIHYGALATKLWNYWQDEWHAEVFEVLSPPGVTADIVGTQMPHWPLDEKVPPDLDCDPYASQGEIIEMSSPWGWTAKIRCPTGPTKMMHSGDVKIFSELMRAALVWARCAEEATAVVGLSALNRDEWQKTNPGPVGGGPQIGDPGPVPKEGTFTPPAPGPGLPPPDEFPAPPAPTAPAPTGMSTPAKLLIGSAVAWLIYKVVKKKS